MTGDERSNDGLRTGPIVVVGPCGSGKSTLVAALTRHGFAAQAVAQEHSIISELWRHGGEPAALIVLDAAPSTITRRRGAEFPEWLYQQQLQRLASARAHADLVLITDQLSANDVVRSVLTYLRQAGIEPRHSANSGGGR